MNKPFRLLFVGVVLTSVSALVIACSNGGGVGSAPPYAPPCPKAAPVDGTPCTELQVCTFGASAVAYCPGGVGAKWQVDLATSSTVRLDAAVPDGPDGADATDSGDAVPRDGATDSVETSADGASELADIADATDSLADLAEAASDGSLEASEVLDGADAADADGASDT